MYCRSRSPRADCCLCSSIGLEGLSSPESWKGGFIAQESLYSYSRVYGCFFSETLGKCWEALLHISGVAYSISLLSKLEKSMDDVEGKERARGQSVCRSQWNTEKGAIEIILFRDNMHSIVD